MTSSRQRQPAGVIDGRGQVVWTIKRIVQMVHAQGLKAGARLPKHQELARQIGVSNDTLTAAMARLMEVGLVWRRARAGTVVSDPAAADQLAWNVGLATIPAPRRGQSSFFAELHFRLQIEFARRGWRGLSYFRFEQAGQPRLPHFRHLENDLADHALDAVLFMTPLHSGDWSDVASTGVVPFHTTFDEMLPDSLLLDHPTMIREAVGRLAADGARTIGIASGRSPGKSTPSLARAVEQSLADLGWPRDRLQFHDAHMLQGGMDLADRVMAMPVARRPEAWVVLDDFVALGMAWRFDAHGLRPPLAACVNSHNPLRFPWPILQFEVQVPDLVDRLMESLHQRLLNPMTPPTQQWFPIKLQSQAPVALTTESPT
jgi:DNA-binding LacI/PurR family transcriptional regulator